MTPPKVRCTSENIDDSDDENSSSNGLVGNKRKAKMAFKSALSAEDNDFDVDTIIKKVLSQNMTERIVNTKRNFNNKQNKNRRNKERKNSEIFSKTICGQPSLTLQIPVKEDTNEMQ